MNMQRHMRAADEERVRRFWREALAGNFSASNCREATVETPTYVSWTYSVRHGETNTVVNFYFFLLIHIFTFINALIKQIEIQ